MTDTSNARPPKQRTLRTLLVPFIIVDALSIAIALLFISGTLVFYEGGLLRVVPNQDTSLVGGCDDTPSGVSLNKKCYVGIFE